MELLGQMWNGKRADTPRGKSLSLMIGSISDIVWLSSKLITVELHPYSESVYYVSPRKKG